jgi:4-amino-4-deoxy-L-arabinose transferase-like glycosyltransferase
VVSVGQEPRQLFRDQHPSLSRTGKLRQVLFRLGFTVLCLLPIFFSLGHPIYGDSEARYGVIARDMAEGQSPLLVPTWFDRPHLTKPPLTYWLIAGSIRLFGDHEWALRLPSAISGALTLAVAFAFARRVYGQRVAVTATALVAVTPLFIALSRLAITDGPLMLLCTGTLTAGALAVREGKARWVCLLWLCVALALLNKGPVAWLPVAALLLWALARRDAPGRARLHLLPGLLASAVPLGGWVLAVAVRYPEAWAIWRYELIHRAAGSGDHPESIWFFIPVFLIGLLPGSALLIYSYANHWKRSRFKNEVQWNFSEFCSLWGIIIVLFFVVFSLISGKLMSYLGPVVVPVGFLATIRLAQRSRTNCRTLSGTPPPPISQVLLWMIAVVAVLILQCIEDRYAARADPHSAVMQVRALTGLEEPEIYTVGFAQRNLAYYTNRHSMRINPRIWRGAKRQLPWDRLVILAEGDRWDTLAAEADWDMTGRYRRVPGDFHLQRGEGPLRMYVPHELAERMPASSFGHSVERAPRPD